MTSTDIAAASKIILGTTEAVAMYIGSTKIWPTGGGLLQHDYSLDYFTIESLEDNNEIKLDKIKSPNNVELSYSTNNGETWTTMTISSSVNFTVINTGDRIIFKGINNTFSSAWDNFHLFRPTKNFKVYGNAMSLLLGDNFINNSTFPSGTTHNLCGLFYNTATLINAENLILPTTTCTVGCYNGMFRGCANLTTAPQLPALYSALDCYSSMFEGCINLEVAPEINLVDMSQNCCKRMFCMNRNNKITTPKMTKSPILRCATGVNGCYEEMFKGNGNLTEVTCLLTNDSSATTNWLLNVSSTGVFYKSPLKTNWQNSIHGYPSGWTIQDYVEPS